MDITNITEDVRAFLTKSFKLQNLKNTDDIFETGLVHSLFFIQLLVFIEKNFNIELKEGEFDIDKLRSIDNIARLIAAKTEKRTPNCLVAEGVSHE